MIKIAGLALVFFFCLSILGPASGCAQSLFHTTTKYDRVADVTTVEGELLNDEVAGGLSIVIYASFRGREQTEKAPEIFRSWLALSISQGKATRKTPARFQDISSLTLRLDDSTCELPIKDYRKDYYEMIQRMGESANVELSQADSSKLHSAKHLSGQWGAVNFKLTDVVMQRLHSFLTRYIVTAPTN